jgi:hypothetical protein
MHRTLQEETAQPPAEHGRGQQRAFDRFRREYNEERPHEALGWATPSEYYAASPRAFPDRLPEVNYEEGWETRSVRASGQIKLGGKDVQVTKALTGERVGLKPQADGVWEVFFATHSLGVLDERSGEIKAVKAERRKSALTRLERGLRAPLNPAIRGEHYSFAPVWIAVPARYIYILVTLPSAPARCHPSPEYECHLCRDHKV